MNIPNLDKEKELTILDMGCGLGIDLILVANACA